VNVLLAFAVLQAPWPAVFEGRTSPEVELAQILDLTTASAGRLAFVLDGAAGVVRVVERSGRQSVAFGRKGEGPGELARAIRLGWVFDTLWIMDAPNRLHYFRQDGRLLRTVAAPRGTYGATEAGGYLTQEMTGTVQGAGPRGAVTISHQNGSIERRIAGVTEFVGVVQVKMRVNGQAGTSFQQQPFRDDPLFLPDRDGRHLFVIRREAGAAPPHVFHVIKLTLTGDTVFAKSYPYRPRALARAHVEEKIGEMRSMGSGKGYRVMIDPSDLEKAMYRPRHLPAVSRAVIGRDGTVWLHREESPGARESTWQVLSATGESLAVVRLPRTERVLEVREDRIWTAARDEDDVPFVKWYRIGPRL
jgi:hypothetical protein